MFSLVSGIISEIKDKATSKTSILVLGIDSAGKSTLVDAIMCHAIPGRNPRTIRPTNGLLPQNITDKKTVITFWDLSGKKEFRTSVWDNYLKDATAVMYVVNGEQEDRIHETRKIFDDISIRYSKPTALVFLNCDRNILNVFPSANRANIVFFLDIKNQEHMGKLYQWLKSTAAKP